MSLFSPKEAQDFIQQPCEKNLDKFLKEEKHPQLFQRTGYHPAFLQLVLQKIWFASDGEYAVESSNNQNLQQEKGHDYMDRAFL